MAKFFIGFMFTMIPVAIIGYGLMTLFQTLTAAL